MKDAISIPVAPPAGRNRVTGKTLTAEFLGLMIAGDPDIMRKYQEWHEAWKLSPEAFFISGSTARIFLQTPDGTIGLPGARTGMDSTVGFHLLRERYKGRSEICFALELEISLSNPSHPVNTAKIGDKWSYADDEDHTAEYEYVGIHKRLRYELIGDTDDVRTIIAPVLS